MGALCEPVAFSTPIRMLMHVYESREIFNCMILRETCKGRSPPCLAFALPGQGGLTRHACHRRLTPVTRCFLRFSGFLPQASVCRLLPSVLCSLSPRPMRSPGGIQSPGGRRRNGFWLLFLPPQQAPCPPPSPPPPIPLSTLNPPTGSRSSVRPRTWGPVVWERRWGRMRCGWRSCQQRCGRWE